MEIKCTFCHDRMAGLFPVRIVAQGMPLDCPDDECLLFCKLECIQAWAGKMIVMRDELAAARARSPRNRADETQPMPNSKPGWDY